MLDAGLFRLELRTTIDPPWTTVDAVAVGRMPLGSGTPSVWVTVEDRGRPLLRIDVYEAEPAPHAFQAAIVWADFVVVGFGDALILVSTITRDAFVFRLAGCFGHLYPLADCLLVADASHLSRFDRRGALQWKSGELGVDGVLVSSVVDGVIEGQGEWDPPGRWQPFRIRLESGAALSQ